MEELLKDFIIPHWGFLTVSAVFAIVGQVSKNTLWTKANVIKYQGSWKGEFMWWMRKTLPLHPVVGGVILGFIPGMPMPEQVDSTVQGVLYYVGAGVSSTWIFSVLKQMAKKKGIDLNVPGAPSIPPPPKIPVN